jgi:hypothetical protein
VAHLVNLGIRNAARHPLRSVLTVGLLAAATFLVVAVEAFHRDPGQDFLTKAGGSGGFPLVVETELPIYQDLNDPRARAELGITPAGWEPLLGTRFYPLRVSTGDDTSCLNLYKPLQPRLLGVPQALIDRGGFLFKSTEAESQEEKQNPWLLLTKQRADGAIPVFGEVNSVEWILHSGLGGEVQVTNDRGETVRLHIAGLLQDCVFQGELLASDRAFLSVYPRSEGFRMFLVEVPPGGTPQVEEGLKNALKSFGVSVTHSETKVATYLAVENTYLATFQALGGLGVLLGALGLAVVLIRSVWERRAELALLRAVGFRRSALGWLVLAENSFLLVLGLGAGTVAALLAVAPHLLSGEGDIGSVRLPIFLAVLLVVGLTAGGLATLSVLRAPLVPALRRE